MRKRIMSLSLSLGLGISTFFVLVPGVTARTPQFCGPSNGVITIRDRGADVTIDDKMGAQIHAWWNGADGIKPFPGGAEIKTFVPAGRRVMIHKMLGQVRYHAGCSPSATRNTVMRDAPNIRYISMSFLVTRGYACWVPSNKDEC